MFYWLRWLVWDISSLSHLAVSLRHRLKETFLFEIFLLFFETFLFIVRHCLKSNSKIKTRNKWPTQHHNAITTKPCQQPTSITSHHLLTCRTARITGNNKSLLWCWLSQPMRFCGKDFSWVGSITIVNNVWNGWRSWSASEGNTDPILSCMRKSLETYRQQTLLKLVLIRKGYHSSRFWWRLTIHFPEVPGRVRSRMTTQTWHWCRNSCSNEASRFLQHSKCIQEVLYCSLSQTHWTRVEALKRQKFIAQLKDRAEKKKKKKS